MITEGVFCTRRGNKLTLDEIIDIGDDDYGPQYNFTCENCGAKYECTEVPEKEKKNYEFYEHEKENVFLRREEPDIMNGYCSNCGHHVSMCNNFMLSDYDETIESLSDDDKMNFILNQCPFCGMQEVRWDNSENEKKQFPYWKEEVEGESTDPTELAKEIVDDLNKDDKDAKH